MKPPPGPMISFGTATPRPPAAPSRRTVPAATTRPRRAHRSATISAMALAVGLTIAGAAVLAPYAAVAAPATEPASSSSATP